MKNIDYLRIKKCPRFDVCSAPICPLDIEKDKRIQLNGEPKCKLGKRRRMKLGYGLPWKGLTPNELAAKTRWEQKSKKEKSEYISRIAKLREKTQFFHHIQKHNPKDGTKQIIKANSDFTVEDLDKKHETKERSS